MSEFVKFSFGKRKDLEQSNISVAELKNMLPGDVDMDDHEARRVNISIVREGVTSSSDSCYT